MLLSMLTAVAIKHIVLFSKRIMYFLPRGGSLSVCVILYNVCKIIDDFFICPQGLMTAPQAVHVSIKIKLSWVVVYVYLL